MHYKTHDLGYKTISEAILSPTGTIFNITDRSDFPLQPLDGIHTLWDESKFNRINLPKNLYQLNEAEISQYSTGEDIRVLDLPIKFPNTDYRLPQELVHLQNLVEKIAQHEHLTNPHFQDYYCYLTLDRRTVTKGKTTRKAGIHCDGFQGSRLGDKLPIDHSYLLYSDLPTLFFNQPFPVQDWWDKTCHNYFEGFQLQKIPGSTVTYPNNTLLLIDPYALHEAPMVSEDTHRTFLRLSYTVREFDRLGNAHNPLFDYQWNMHPRDTQMTLSCPIK